MLIHGLESVINQQRVGQEIAIPDRIIRYIRDYFIHRVDQFIQGRLYLKDPFGTEQLGHGSNEVRIQIHDTSVYLRTLIHGTVALGETYAEGLWETDDLPDFLTFLASNRGVSEDAFNFWQFTQPLQHFISTLTPNTVQTSKQNIRAHYDLGNEFYETFLDSTLTYSSAYYQDRSDRLEDAQKRKLDRICRELDLTPDHQVLEIGSGWGSFCIYAAEEYGCSVTTTTISENQYEYVSEQVQERGLESNVTVLKKDYRNLDGIYDRIVSIEMIEAVGEEYLQKYFDCIDSHLKDSGQVFLQAIHYSGQFYEEYRNTVDFIQKYIFPGGHLPSINRITECLSETSLRISGLDEIGEDYAKTLRTWRENFTDNLTKIRSLGFDEKFIRLWQYYLSYCEAGFRAEIIGNYQIQLRRRDIFNT